MPRPPLPNPSSPPRPANASRRWTLLAAAPALLLAALLALHQIDEVDYWWQLRTGQITLLRGIPDSDQLTYTQTISSKFGQPRIESSWLYNAALALAEKHLTPEGISLLVALLVTATALLALASVLHRSPRINLPLLALLLPLAIIGASPRFTARPETCSYLFLTYFLFILEREHAQGRSRLLWTLPLLQALWANIHSLFPLGLAALASLVAITLFDTFSRNPAVPLSTLARRSAVLLLSLLACLCTPYTTLGLLVPLDQFRAILPNQPSRTSALLLLASLSLLALFLIIALARILPARTASPAPTSRTRTTAAITLGLLLLTYLLLATSPITPLGSIDRQKLAELTPTLAITSLSEPLLAFKLLTAALLAAAIAWGIRRAPVAASLAAAGAVLSLLAVRNIPLLCWPAFIAILRIAPPISLPLSLPSRILISLAASITIFQSSRALSSDFWSFASTSRRFGLGIEPLSIPKPAADFLAAQNATRLFNTQPIGSYLASRGFPVYLDSRASGPLLDAYRAIVEPAPSETSALEAAHAAFGFSWIIADHQSLPFISRLASDPRWLPAFADHAAVVFARNNAPPPQTPFPIDLHTLNSDPSTFFPRIHTARSLLILDRPSDAAPLFEAALSIAPSRFTDWSALGLCRERLRQYLPAADAYKRAATQEPPQSPGRRRLLEQHAEMLLAASAFPDAQLAAQSLLTLFPDSARAHYILGTSLLQQKLPGQALPLLSRAASLDPNVDALSNLAATHTALNNFPAAKDALLAAWNINPSDPRTALDLAEISRRMNQPQEHARWLRTARSLSRPNAPRP
jgi:tetratricopeptide (TPR) repeat protein